MKVLCSTIILILCACLNLNSALAGYPPPADDVIRFQPFRTEKTLKFQDEKGHEGVAQLINLNRFTNSWYVLFIQWPGAKKASVYNLEKPDTADFQMELVERGLLISAFGQQTLCDIYSAASPLRSSAYGPYTPICQDRVFWRNQGSGSSGGLQEWGANLLRDNFGSYGEQLVDMYKQARGDAGLVEGKVQVDANGLPIGSAPNKPQRALISPTAVKAGITVPDMNIDLLETRGGRALAAGEWYSVKSSPGVFFSSIRAEMLDPDLLKSYPTRVNQFDSVESKALSYMVAFDLADFDLGWSHGSRLPGVGWSTRGDHGSESNLDGPDGFSSVEPLNFSGMLNPSYLPRLVGVMCGGFQRHHGVFKSGELSKVNDGSFYGFIDNGVILSRLNPGLATFIVYQNGQVDLKTWTENDNQRLNQIRYARQNGVALVDRDPVTGEGIPGAFVNSWGQGNWSGTPDRQLRSQRAGVCLSVQGQHRYLIYGNFTAANPSSMAQVFRGYNCQYAMHLDMNSAGQTYLGLFSVNNGQPKIELPQAEMRGLNTSLTLGSQKVAVPRYVGSPDQADFFFILRKKSNR